MQCILLIMILGVRQRTVRQTSTMDNAGTLPIYAYNNTAIEQYDEVDQQVLTAAPHIPSHPDNIEEVDVRPTTSRTGRTRKQPVRSDMVLY